jgi:hypothetical protein
LPVSHYLRIGVNVWNIYRFRAIRAFGLFRVTIPTTPLTLDSTLSFLQASTMALALVVIMDLTSIFNMLGRNYFCNISSSIFPTGLLPAKHEDCL